MVKADLLLTQKSGMPSRPESPKQPTGPCPFEKLSALRDIVIFDFQDMTNGCCNAKDDGAVGGGCWNVEKCDDWLLKYALAEYGVF